MKRMILALILTACDGMLEQAPASAANPGAACDPCPGAASVATTIFLPDGGMILDGGADPGSLPDGTNASETCICENAPPGHGFAFTRGVGACEYIACQFTAYCATGARTIPFDAGCQ